MQACLPLSRFSAAGRERAGDDEDEDDEDEDEDGEEFTTVTDGGPRSLKEHRDRLCPARAEEGFCGALGPQFAANPREFGRDAAQVWGCRGWAMTTKRTTVIRAIWLRARVGRRRQCLAISRYAEGGYGDGDEDDDEDEDEDDGYRMGASGLPLADSDGDGDYDGRSPYSGGARVRICTSQRRAGLCARRG